MTTPTGKLMWGQAGAYDGVDDRAVIAAVTRNRTGLTWPAAVTAQTGLTLKIAGGWLGVASCGDSTSAVVGSRTDQTVTATAGPPTGSRTDYVWCDVAPDSGTWSLSVITSTAAAGRSGLPLATLTVPANATLASQMTITNADALLERGLVGYKTATPTGTYTGQFWGTTPNLVATDPVLMVPGEWYRERLQANAPAAVTGSLSGRLGIGYRAPGGNDASSTMVQAVSIAYTALNTSTHAAVERIYRHPVNAAPVYRQYDGRVWVVGSGSFKPCSDTSFGAGLILTVEDLGS